MLPNLSQLIPDLTITQLPFQSSLKLNCLETMMAEPSWSPPPRRKSTVPSQLTLTWKTQNLLRDQKETRNRMELSIPLFKTMEMTNKNGKKKNIQVNLLTTSDLSIKLTIALLPKIHLISREPPNLLMLSPSSRPRNLALSGSLNNPEMPGTLLWPSKV